MSAAPTTSVCFATEPKPASPAASSPAHGFIFLSIEDETGISNAIIDPELYERNRSLVTHARFLLVEGTLQNVDKVIHIRAKHLEELNVTAASTQSHDFH
jgi:error-prone DNA polymerase